MTRRFGLSGLGLVFGLAASSIPWAAAAPAYDCGVAPDGSLRQYVPGVLRPDEGTIEVTVTFSKPTSEFGNNWEFIFATECGNSVGPGGISMLTAYIPPEPEKGLTFLLRTSRGGTYLNLPTFVCRRGDKMNLAFSWGKELRCYVNGVLKGRTGWKGPLEPNLFSPFMTVERFGPYNTTQMRISTRERTAAELNADPERPFVPDDDTACIAGQGLSQYELRTTAWHRESAYAFLLPMLRTEAQCFNEGDAVALPFLAVNYGSQPVTRAVRCVGQNADGKEVLYREIAVTIPPSGRHAILSISLPELNSAGHYPLSVNITGPTGAITYPLAVAVIGRDEPNLKEGAFGRFYGQHHHPEWDASVWERMHVRSSRAWSSIFTFLWWSVEPVDGEFDFRKSDAYVRQCRDAGMEVLGVLGYPSRWAAIESSDVIKKSSDLAIRPERWAIRDIAAWKRYIYTTVLRYKDQVQHWEIYNEVNFHPPAAAATFAGSTSDYFELLQAAYTEAKRANPNAQVVMSGFSPNADRAMPTDLLAMGAASHFDIFATHAYNGSFKGIDSDWANAFWKLRPDGTYWQTEQMWHTLADDSLRAYKTVEIYVDFLVNRCARFFNMGDVGIFFDRNTKSPKIDYCAIAGVQQNLRVCDSFGGTYAFPGGETFTLRHHFQRSDGRTLSVLGSLAARHQITVQGDVVAAYDLLQRPLALQRDGNRTILPQESVVYVISAKPLTVERVVATGGIPVALRNGGFENYTGDDAAGLEACQALDWTLRDTRYDPQGRIVLNERSRTGKSAARLHSSGAGNVYVFQEVTLRAPGTYRLSGYFRAEAGASGLVPWLFVFDNNTNRTTGQRFPATMLVVGEWIRCEYTIRIPGVGQAPLAIGFGIGAGTGALTIDDLSFGLVANATAEARLTNVSVLTALAAADPQVVVGTVVGGAGTVGGRSLLARAVGPSLLPFGVSAPLANPRLEVRTGAATIAANDDWGGTAALRSAFDRAGAFAFTAANSPDAAIVMPDTFTGAHTVEVTAADGGTGTVLVELYDLGPADAPSPPAARVLNVSVRKLIPPGGLLTSGFVIAGQASQEVLIRAVGPTLGTPPFNVAGAMANPKVDLFRNSSVIATNDDWGGAAELVEAFDRTGAFTLPAASRDAALLATLTPGAYTVQASGVSGSTGQALLEVYAVP